MLVSWMLTNAYQSWDQCQERILNVSLQWKTDFESWLPPSSTNYKQVYTTLSKGRGQYSWHIIEKTKIPFLLSVKEQLNLGYIGLLLETVR